MILDVIFAFITIICRISDFKRQILLWRIGEHFRILRGYKLVVILIKNVWYIQDLTVELFLLKGVKV